MLPKYISSAFLLLCFVTFFFALLGQFYKISLTLKCRDNVKYFTGMAGQWIYHLTGATTKSKTEHCITSPMHPFIVYKSNDCHCSSTNHSNNCVHLSHLYGRFKRLDKSQLHAAATWKQYNSIFCLLLTTSKQGYFRLNEIFQHQLIGCVPMIS